jgi:beta-glucosidase
VKELKSFAKVALTAGQKQTVHLPLRIRDLRRWEGDTGGRWTIDSGTYTIEVGKDADDADNAMNPTQGPLTVQGY